MSIYFGDMRSAKEMLSKRGWSIRSMIPSGAHMYAMSGGMIRVNPCPVCGHNDCFTINTATDRWRCFSAQHNSGGDIIDLYSEINSVSLYRAVIEMRGRTATVNDSVIMRFNSAEKRARAERKKPPAMDESIWSRAKNALIHKNDGDIMRVYGWGIDKSVMYDVGYMEHYGRPGLLAPKLDPCTGKVVGPWHIKYLDHQNPKSRSNRAKFILGGSVYRQFTYCKPLVVLGGLKDMLSARMLGFQALGLDGEGYIPTDAIEMFSLFKGSIVFFLDGDEPGLSATKKHIKDLRENQGIKQVYAVQHPDAWIDSGYKDLTEYRSKLRVPDRDLIKLIYASVGVY